MTPYQKILHVIGLCGDYTTPPNAISRIHTLEECAKHTAAQFHCGNITQLEVDNLIQQGQKVLDEIREMAVKKTPSPIFNR